MSWLAPLAIVAAAAVALMVWRIDLYTLVVLIADAIVVLG